MPDKSLAWVVPISSDEDVPGACISGALLRKHLSSEPVIAFVSKWVNTETIRKLQNVFDQIVLAPEAPECGKQDEKNILLLQTLKLNAFSSLLVVQAGTLVFRKFDKALEATASPLKNQESKWTIVAVTPNPLKYLEALRLLKDGQPFELQFIYEAITLTNNGQNLACEEVVYSWSDLKYHNGLRMPLVQLNSEMANFVLQQSNSGCIDGKLETKGFWQKVVYSELEPVIKLLEVTEDWSNEDNQNSWIAIVGMSCRFPNSNSVDEYWQVLTSGQNTAGPPPSNRLGKCDIDSKVRANFLKCPIDEFDSGFFGLAPNEVAITDPQARLLLETSWEAFEDAGINPEKLRNNPVGIFYGSWERHYLDLINMTQPPKQDAIRKYVGNGFACAASKLSFFYGFTGPNIAIESSCSSSIGAVELACQSLQLKRCPVALAAGANVILHLDPKIKVVWAPDGVCKTFDSKANGYGKGEGVGVLVLKRYSDALRDGDRIHGIIRGTASSQEGLSKSFGAPTVDNEANTMMKAMKAAGVSPTQIDYVEAHATGTRVGDPIEAEAIVKAYSSKKNREIPLWIGSGKTVIGHSESCSGIAGIIKVLLAMKHETIPAHINIEAINPKVDFNSIPGNIPLKSQDWKKSLVRPRIAGVSNFGLSGTAFHMIVQEPPEYLPAGSLLKDVQDAPLHILTLSSKTIVGLEQLSKSFLTFIEKAIEAGVKLEDIAYTANACRAHHSFRRSVVGRNKEEILLQLREKLTTKLMNIQSENLKIGFIICDSLNQMDFEQYFVLYSTFPAFQIQMDFCDSVCKDISGVSPKDYLLQNKLPLSTTSITQQLCSFSVAYSLFKLWESWGLKADFVVGSNRVGELIEEVSKGSLELHIAIKMITELKMCGDKLDEQEINSSALAKFSTTGCNVIIEIGSGRCFPTSIQLPKDTLILQKIEGKGLAASLFTSLAVLYEAGYPIDWEGFYVHRQYSKVSLPHYPFQRKSIWFEGRKSLAYPEADALIQNWKQVHPLLGNYASEREPSSNDNLPQTHTFESPLQLVLQHGPYLSHHVIGSELIFPASAYIEMLLAAYSFQGQDNTQGLPIIVENFKVDAPLRLTNKDSECGVKTIMTKSEPNATASKWDIIVEAKVKREDEDKSWKPHASGEVTGGHQQLNYESLKTQQYNLDEIKKRCVEKEQAAPEFYHRLTQVGLNFGPNFKSLRTIYQSDKETLATVRIPQDAVHYVTQPLLSDAMIQCYMIHKHTNLTTLHVPVSIGKFVCYRRLTPWECSSSSTNLHVYFNEGEDSVFLLDSEGKTIATMTQLEVKATTVSSILSAAGLSKNEGDGPLDMWQVCWKPASGYQTSGSLNLMGSVKDFTQSPSYISLLKSLESRNRFTSREAHLFKSVSRLCELYVLKAFYEMGWKPQINDSFQITPLANQLKITGAFLPAFRHYLGYLVENGMLEENKITSVLTVKAAPESLTNVEHSITEHLTSLSSYGPLQCLKACGNALASVLQGKIKGQQILFVPVENGLTYADIMYKTNPFYGKARASVPVFIEIVTYQWKSCLAMKEKENNGERKLRILEVGGGTGAFTAKAISLLEEEAIDYSYHFTDISSAFLKKGESCFPNNFTFKILNIEKDPLEQGFPPGYFDIIIGQDVLHATKDLRISLGHLKMLLKPGGNILIGETAKPVIEADLSFGLVDGYWRFEDFNIRSTHCTISAQQWVVLLKECGFGGPSSKTHIAENHYCTVVGTLSEPDEKSIKIKKKDENKAKSWLLLHDLEDTNGFIKEVQNRMAYLGRDLRSLSLQEFQEVITSECGGLAGYLNPCGNLEGILCFFNGADDKLASNNCRSLLEPLLFVSKYMIGKGSWNTVPRLCVATSGLWKECESQTNPSSASLWGFLRSARMETPWLTTKLVDLDPDEGLDAKVESLIQEIWMGDDETEAVYRAGIRYSRRLTKASSQTKDILEIPTQSKDYTIKLPDSNLLTDLLYIPKNIEELGENEVIVEVRAAALNFRDVFSVLKPSDRFKNLDVMGMDFSGMVVKVGDKIKALHVGVPVFGICLTKSTISGYVSAPIQNLAVIPHGITFAEAATLPVAFLTAWYCLVDVANASLGQTVLIHAASGGVGLVAVQIANHLGLNIIATAGSQKKRNFLRSLGIINVFNSRTLEYGEQIKNITNGQGVDIILNCLTGPGFKETSLEICREGGHFVEISKLDIWKEGEVEKRKPGVKYTIVDLTIVEPIVITNMLKDLSRLLTAGSLKPLPITRFTASRIVSALQFLQKAKHIGKVIVEMPKFDGERKTFRDMLFNDRSTYLIAGGKGAIGPAIVEWMVSHGAKYIVLLGRGSPKDNVLDIIHKLGEEDGAKISCMEANVANFEEMRKVFQDIEADSNLPPLRGIHHCAGVLSDKMIVSQNWENFEHVLDPKVKGAYNLHALTLETPLEFFVVHSSVTCTLGNFGQSNYTAGNLYMEALIDKRVSNGLPGTSISWGHWNAGLSENIEVVGMQIFSMQKGIAALEKILQENINSIDAAFFNPHKIAVLFSPYEKTLLENILMQSHAEVGDSGTDTKMEMSLLEAYSKAEGSQEKESLVRNMVIKKLSDTLGVAPQDVSENVKFSRMGLDSLLSIEFYNKLQSQLGEIDLGHIDMEEDGTVPKIAGIIRAALDNNTLV